MPASRAPSESGRRASDRRRSWSATSRASRSSPRSDSPARRSSLASSSRRARRPRRLLLAAGDERHHAAQLLADRLDLTALGLRAQLLHARAAGLDVADELLGERARADLLEDPAHLLAHVGVDDARPAREVAVLGRVGDGVAHALEAALVHQVDDQLELVEALEVRDLGLVARRDERLEAGLDERGGAAAEHGLLTEEVGDRLFLERRLKHAGATAADAGGPGQRRRWPGPPAS